MADREPQDRLGRPSGEMHDAADRTPHADHDLLVIAGGTDPDADPATRAAAARQAANCTECDELARDLRAIAVGLQSLPRSIPVPAARDFRISPDQARRLQRGNGLRRLLRPFGPGGMPSLRPLSAALTTLGVAGLLFTLVLPGMSAGAFRAASGELPTAVSGQAVGGDAAASIPTTKENASSYGPAAAPGVALGSPAPESSSRSLDFGTRQSVQPVRQPPSLDTATPTPAANVSAWSPTAVLSVVLLAVGLLLFVLRVAAYRLR